MASPFEQLAQKILKYNPNCDLAPIQKAFQASSNAHAGQHRVSGDPYITHPLEVAMIIADLEMDTSSIIAALLHDTIEDTTFTQEEITKEFGDEVAMLVIGLTKLEKLKFQTRQEQQAENLRKMFLAMSKDIRVILIKLADRLHNMRTLKYMREDKQIEKARETLDIFAPIAHRLGILKIKWELEDLCLRYIDPKGYYELVDKISIRRKEREAFIETITDSLNQKITEIGITPSLDGRPKHFYSIYKKMLSQGKSLEEIYDLFAVRIIVHTVKECYTVLGLVHEMYKPMPGRFKDYIAMPKPNLYQSLHTTLIGPKGTPFEIQIRTWDMHEIAEVGIAAHWKYKNGNSLSQNHNLDSKITWLRQVMEWEKDAGDPEEFMENLKIDLFTDEVFVFTPKGEVVNLRAGSSPIDFAYEIHSAIGNKMMGAKVNGKIVPLDYALQNGDIVEVLTGSNIHGPSRDWLKIVKTSQARNKINQWFKKEKREENILRGKDAVEREIKKQGFTLSQLLKPDWVETTAKKYSFTNTEDLYATIGLGALTPNRLVTRLKEEYRKTLKPEELDEKILEVATKKEPSSQRKLPEQGIIVKGIENCLVKLSRCCNPVPGDNIIGYITRGRGVSVHTQSCPNVNSYLDGENRLIEVSWQSHARAAYLTDITIFSEDKAGLVFEVTNIFAESKVSIKGLMARTNKDNKAIINITLEVSNTEQLEKMIHRLHKIQGVIEISRKKL